MTLWIADASIACKWHFDEDNAPLARALLQLGDEIAAPESLLSEFANAISRKIREGRFPQEQAEEAMELVSQQITRLVPVHELLSAALDISVALRHPIYDCLYLALAEREGVMLVTDDHTFLRKTADSRWRQSVISLQEFAEARIG